MNKYYLRILVGIALTLLVTSCQNDEPTTADVAEPNDNINSAYEVTVNESLTAYINPEDDVDFFTLSTSSTPAAGGVLIFSLAPFPLRPEMAIYNHDKSEIRRSHDATEGANLHIWVAAKTANSYYVKVNSWIKQSTSDSYTLTVNYTAIDDSNEPDNDFDRAKTINLDNNYSAYLFAGEPTDKQDYNDYYKVTIPGGALKARLENVPTNIPPEMILYNSDRSLIAGKHDMTSGANLTVVTPRVEAGDYYIVVRPWIIPNWHGNGKTPSHHAISPYSITVTLE